MNTPAPTEGLSGRDQDAITRECQLRKWSRAKRLALAGGDIDRLRQLRDI